jgi:phage gp36-like protein
MAYISQPDLENVIPPPHFRAFLDDTRDGQADAGLLERIMDAASNEVDAYIAPVHSVPLTSASATAKAAAVAFACEMLYTRRMISGDNNPWTARADSWREKLGRIGSGDLPLDVGVEASASFVAAVTDAVYVANASYRL